jgi:TRAP-type uncharacterized transport system substrate-binding protein
MHTPPSHGNLRRGRTLAEIALHLAMSPPPDIPRGTLDACIALGSGSGEAFEPRLRLATGTPCLAHAVARGDIDFAFVNPSAMLTQAYRGTGFFRTPLPLRAVASYPSWDRFACVVHPRTGLESVAQIRERRYPLRLSIRRDPMHATRALIDEMLAVCGFTLDDLQAWGGSLVYCDTPGDPGRIGGVEAGEIDAIFDEGIRSYLEPSLALGMRPLQIDDEALGRLETIGWRRAVIPAGRFSGLAEDYVGVDFSGWPLYTRESLPEEDAYAVCAAIAAKVDAIPWEPDFPGVARLGQDSDATPLGVPLHPGAARWYREQGVEVS